MGKREPWGIRRANRKSGVCSEARTRPKRQPEPALEFEEGHCSDLELGAHYSLGREAKTVSVEGYGALEVVDTEGN